MADRSNGLYFPIILDGNGAPEYPGLLDSIDASIRHIVAWLYGTRAFIYPFGSVVELLINSPGSKRLAGLLSTYLKRAIARWETRIKVTSISFTIDDSTVTVKIEAYIPQSNVNYEFQDIL